MSATTFAIFIEISMIWVLLPDTEFRGVVCESHMFENERFVYY